MRWRDCEEFGEIEAEVKDLRKQMEDANRRLDVLEGKQTAESPQVTPQVGPIQEEPEAAPETRAPEAVSEDATQQEALPMQQVIVGNDFRLEPIMVATIRQKEHQAEGQATPLEQIPPLPPLPPPPRAHSEYPASHPRWEWEQILGRNWLARIGILALVIGAGFFLKFAFDRQWISPLARVILGSAGGLALLAAGNYWRKRYPAFAQALSGGGIALLYLCVFTAFAIFNLIPIYPAIVLLLAISAGSALLALRFNSMALAIIGILGAFCAPFILGGAAHRAVSDSNGVELLIYIMAVDIGVLALSAFRNWRWFALIALVLSYVSYVIWWSQLSPASFLAEQLGLTLMFLIFAGTTVLYQLLRRKPARIVDYSLLMINALAFFGIEISLISGMEGWMGLLSVLLAVFYAGIAYASYRRSAENTLLRHFSSGVAVLFLTIAIPVQFTDQAWTTIGWAAEGAVLLWLSFRIKSGFFRYYSYGALALMTGRLLQNSLIGFNSFQPVLNEGVLAFGACILIMYLIAHYIEIKKAIFTELKDLRLSLPVILAIANILSLWLMGREIADYTSLSPNDPGILTLTLFMVISGLLIFQHLYWQRRLPLFSTVFIPLNAVVILALSIFLWGDFRAWISSLYLILAVFNGILAYLFLRENPENILSSQISLGIAVLFLNLAIPMQFAGQPWMAISWAAEGLVFMLLSGKLNFNVFRYYSYASFALMAGRLLTFDISLDYNSVQPVLNERVLAFGVCIAITYLTVHILARQKRTFPDINIGLPALLVGVDVLSFCLIGAELAEYNTYSSMRSGNLVLTLFLVLSGLLTLQHLFWRRRIPILNAVLVPVNAIVIFVFTLYFWRYYREWLGGILLLYAVIHGLLAYYSLKGNPANKWPGKVALAVALVFLNLAIPIQFERQAWTPIFWALEFTGLVYFDRCLGLNYLRKYSYALFLLLTGCLLIFYTRENIRGFQPVFNSRFMAYTLSILLMYLAIFLLLRKSSTTPERRIFSTILLVVVNFLTIWLISFEGWDYFGQPLAIPGIIAPEARHAIKSAQVLSLTVVWSLYAVIALAVGIIKRSKYTRLAALALLAIPVVKVFAYDVLQLEQVYRIIAFVGLGVLLIISGYLYHRYSAAIKGFLTE